MPARKAIHAIVDNYATRKHPKLLWTADGNTGNDMLWIVTVVLAGALFGLSIAACYRFGAHKHRLPSQQEGFSRD